MQPNTSHHITSHYITQRTHTHTHTHTRNTHNTHTHMQHTHTQHTHTHIYMYVYNAHEGPFDVDLPINRHFFILLDEHRHVVLFITITSVNYKQLKLVTFISC